MTVRPGGHVLPEKVETDLPRATAAIRAAGLKLPMITTVLLSGSEPTARPILSTAGNLKIPYLKPGYYKYKIRGVPLDVTVTTPWKWEPSRVYVLPALT